MNSKRSSTKVGLMIVGFLFLIIIISASCAGCELNALAWESGNIQEEQNDNAQPNITTTIATTTTTAVVTTTIPQPPEFLNPLTGLESSEEVSSSRPIAVCIGNTAASLPQYGIGAADIVVEAPVEGGITRLMIIGCEFANESAIGSVRSTRSYLADLANDFDAVQSYIGTSDTGASIAYPGYDTLDYIIQNMTATYYSDAQRISPHHLMTTGERLLNAIRLNGYRTTVSSKKLPFDFVDYFEQATLSNNDSLYVRIPFSSAHTPEFKYDATTKSYQRYQFGALHTDGKTGQALSFSNLIILFCDTVTYDKSSGTEISIDIHSGGTGYCISGGKYIDIIWNRDDKGNLRFCDKSGETIKINRGKTYIALVKISSKNSIVLNAK